VAPAEKIEWSIPADLPEVEILSVENSRHPWCVYHQTYTICNIDSFIEEGREPCPGPAEWAYRRRHYSNPPRTLMLMEPGEVHRNTKNPHVNFSVALFNTKLVDGIALEAGLGPNPHFREATTSDARSYNAFVRFHAALHQPTTTLHRQSLLVGCISRLLAAHSETNPRRLLHPGREPVRRARDFLEHCFEESVTLEQLARVSGLSRFHFLRAFNREFGLPPHAYQVRLRVEKARLLLQTGMPIGEINVGFADQSHLTRHFRRVWGVTPGQYAAMVGTSRRT
jgi:AraC-like DNA-binding protein